jgi:translocation protein SEC63
VNVKTLGDFLSLTEEEKKNKLKKDDEEFAEVLKVVALFPKLKIETKLFVEEEEEVDDDEDDFDDKKKVVAVVEKKEEEKVEKTTGAAVVVEEKKVLPKGDEIYEQDFVTLKITLTRENLLSATTTASTDKKKNKKNITAAPVYAPFFPKTLCEGWWIVLTDKPRKASSSNDKKPPVEVNIHAFEKIVDQSAVVVHEVRFMAPSKAGTYEMELQVLSDCYLGLDQTINIDFKVLPAALLPEYQPHPEDLELDNEPTLFEQVMAANVDDSSDDDDEEEEGEKKTGGKKSSANKKKNEKKISAKSSNSKTVEVKKAVTAVKGLVVEDVDEESEED